MSNTCTHFCYEINFSAFLLFSFNSCFLSVKNFLQLLSLFVHLFSDSIGLKLILAFVSPNLWAGASEWALRRKAFTVKFTGTFCVKNQKQFLERSMPAWTRHTGDDAGREAFWHIRRWSWRLPRFSQKACNRLHNDLCEFSFSSTKLIWLISSMTIASQS